MDNPKPNNGQPPKKKKCLTRAQLADQYGVTSETLRRWIIRAKIEIPKNQLLTPASLQQLFKVLGDPY